VADASIAGLGAIVVLAALGGLYTSIWMRHRIDSISRISQEIMCGDLDRRIPMRGSDDEFDHLAASLNAMLDRIQELMRGVQQVSNDIAHDLRTPLTRLRQRLELASRRTRSTAELQATLVGSIADVDAILDTFSALLRIAQVEAGTRRAGFGEVNLSLLLSELVEAYQLVAEEQNQSLVAAVDETLTVHGDRDLLMQLFANLIENAIRHTPRGAVIHVDATAFAGSVDASVSDDGSGIPDLYRKAVLRPFYRLEASRTTPGSGLGLSLGLAIATLHEAKLELLDNNPGLRCVVRFPRREHVGVVH
jgi:signal transduction histidine kinase